MTMTFPLRFMILHFSHMGFTEGLTFMILTLHNEVWFRLLLTSPGYSAAGEIVRRHLHRYFVARKDPDKIHTELTGDMCQDFVAVTDVHKEHRIRQRFYHGTLKLDYVIFCQAYDPP